MKKRKAPAPASKPAKRARQLPDYAKLLRRSRHNETQSLLAKLPAEVRRLIWSYVFGDHLLHFHLYSHSSVAHNKVVPPDQKSLRMRVCLQEGTWEELFAKWLALPAPAPDMKQADLHQVRVRRLSEHSHSECSELYEEDDPWNPILEKTINFKQTLSVLATCKMVHREAQHAIWTQNCFSFSHYDTLRIFIKRCTPDQRRLLKTIRISVELAADTWDAVYWKVALPENDVQLLQGLTGLHVYLRDGTIHAHDSDRERKIAAASMCVDNFKPLPLTKVTVIIDSHGPRMFEGLSHLQRVKWAAQLRKDLLKPMPKKKQKWEGISWNQSC